MSSKVELERDVKDHNTAADVAVPTESATNVVGKR